MMLAVNLLIGGSVSGCARELLDNNTKPRFCQHQATTAVKFMSILFKTNGYMVQLDFICRSGAVGRSRVNLRLAFSSVGSSHDRIDVPRSFRWCVFMNANGLDVISPSLSLYSPGSIHSRIVGFQGKGDDALKRKSRQAGLSSASGVNKTAFDVDVLVMNSG